MDGDLASSLTQCRFNSMREVLGRVNKCTSPSSLIVRKEHVLGNEKFPLLFTDFRVEVLSGLASQLIVECPQNVSFFFGRFFDEFLIRIKVQGAGIHAARQHVRFHEIGAGYGLLLIGCGQGRRNNPVKVIPDDGALFIFRVFSEFFLLIKTQNIGVEHGHDLLGKSKIFK